MHLFALVTTILAAVQDPALDSRQQRAVRNGALAMSNAEEKIKEAKTAWVRLKAELATLTETTLDQRIGKQKDALSDAQKSCDRVTRDLDSAKCPAEHSEVKKLRERVETARKDMIEITAALDALPPEYKVIAGKGKDEKKKADIEKAHADAVAKFEELDKLLASATRSSQLSLDSHIRLAEDRFQRFEKVADPADGRVAELRKRLEDLLARVTSRRQELRDAEIAAERPPKDVYAGADKEERRKQVLAKWKEIWPKDEVLEVRFAMEQWKRTTKKEVVGNELKLYDYSELSCRVIVKTDPKIATIYVALFHKDHLQEDRVTVGVYTKGGSWIVTEMLLENLDK